MRLRFSSGRSIHEQALALIARHQRIQRLTTIHGAVLAVTFVTAGCQDQYMVCDAWSGGGDDYAVFGKVSEAESAEPIFNAHIRFNSSEGLVDYALTDEHGCYHRELRVTNFDGASHRWHIEVNQAGYRAYRADLGIHPAGDSVRRDVSLDRSGADEPR